MTKQTTDKEDVPLPLKKRARRRLVGAAALALFAAIVLPMLMDKEPKPSAPDIQIYIPSQAMSEPMPPIPALPAAVPSVLPPPPVVPRPVSPAVNASWNLQLGVFQDAENARQLQTKLKIVGYNAYAEPLKMEGGIRKLRVWVGPFVSRETAEQAQKKLKRMGINGLVAQKQ